MAYDGEGHRTMLRTTSAAGQVATRTFAYQGAAIVEERLTDAGHSDAIVRSYVVDEAGGVVKLIIPAGEPDAGTYLPTWNGHGDALALWRQNADGTLTLANSFTYSTWGAPSTAIHNGIGDLGFRFLYVGRYDVQWDDAFGLGLLYMHARHYSPSLGRFLQPDPARADGGLYGYSEGSPVTRIDPTGLDDWWKYETVYSRRLEVPTWVRGLAAIGGSVGCGALTRRSMHPVPWLLITAGCGLASWAFNPLPYDLETYTVQTNSWYNEIIVREAYYIRSPSGQLHLDFKTTWSFTKTQKCLDYLTFRTGTVGLSRMPMSWYCSPNVANNPRRTWA